jgi:RNA polymerase sigma-70 factor (ECF subfamily)
MSTSAPDAAETDLELLERIQKGEDQALGELYDRHCAVMYSLARSIVSEPADAEEVVADAFLQIWRGASPYDRGRASVGAFLAVVTRSRALDMVRARRRRGAAEDRAAAGDEGGRAIALSASDPAPDRALELRETNAIVRRALDALPEAPKEVILLAYFGGYSQTEIAARLSEPLGTVKTRVRAGMQKLREALSSHALEVEA